MAIYLKKFETQAAYEAAQSGLILPNVSLTVDNNTVHYNPLVETKLVVYYDIQSISTPTTIFSNYDNSVKSIEVDGTLLDSVVTTYQFDSVGEHVIKYEFNNPTKVGDTAPLFHQISDIKRVVIPNVFTSIGVNAFNGCYDLTSVTIPDSVTSIGIQAFYQCEKLTSIDIPSGVTSIGDYTFYRCNSLTSCTIGSSVAIIGNSAFTQCYSLTSIDIPSGVTSIGSGAFESCTGLTSVTVNTTTPPVLGGNAFEENASGRKIYVQSASVEVYKAATNWSTYASDIEPIP